MFGCFTGWGAGGWGLVGGIFGLLAFLSLIAAVVVVGLLWMQKSRSTAETYPRAIAASAETPEVRYARGELTREEYQRLREHGGGRGER
jgi:uncharacterized membrane protein